MKVYKPTKQNREKTGGRKIFGTFIILIIIVGFLASAWFLFSLLNPTTLNTTEFTISEGEGVNQISASLAREGIVKNKFVFETYVFLKGIENELKAGQYQLPQVLNIKRLTEILVIGERPEEWELTVIEGWTIYDIAFKLELDGKFQAEELFEATGFNQPGNKYSIDISSYDFLDDLPSGKNLEGYMFPDTYRFFAYATVEDIVRKMLNNFENRLTDKMIQDILDQDKSIFDILTVASIIEKEVTTDSDRAIVSGIFWKRLEAGMPLQADSTINYITRKKTPAVSAEDLELDSMYNTYKYPGLPPGPICNPGIESIKAAIYPEDTEYWFFLTDSEGNVHYAEDFDGHKENKVKYL